jgi:hypothetical protein
MTIEVRQMVIRSSVETRRPAYQPLDEQRAAATMERLKGEILTECKEWLRERLQEGRER